MVPVGQGDDALFVVLSEIRIFGTRKNKGLAEAIRVLALNMGVVPVGTGLVDLRSLGQSRCLTGDLSVTVKLYVKVTPGGIPHWVASGAPSISDVPFWKKPCQWMLVDSFPSELWTFAMMRSPNVQLSTGRGH